jgi:hypothetical protein
MGTPSSSSTSAEPERLDTERLPCFATKAPQAEARTAAAVDRLTVFAPSPPVPTISKVGFEDYVGTVVNRTLDVCMYIF